MLDSLQVKNHTVLHKDKLIKKDTQAAGIWKSFQSSPDLSILLFPAHCILTWPAVTKDSASNKLQILVCFKQK